MSTPLKRARQAIGLTQAKLAKLVGTQQSIISRLESGAMRAGPEIAAQIAPHVAISEMEILYPERYQAPAESKKRRAA